MKAPAAKALDLPWLCPSASSLAALARNASTSGWMAVRHDPACLLLLARVQAASEPHLPSLQTILDGPAVLETSLSFLAQHGEEGWIDWRLPVPRALLARGTHQAGLAERLAAALGADPAQAWCAGLLAPLGAYALIAIGHEAQDQSIPVDARALTRRLCRAWRLPAWLSAIIGNLHLPVSIAQQLGAPAGLFQVVQLAVGVVAEPNSFAGPESGHLPWAREDIERWTEEAGVAAAGVDPSAWQQPSEAPFLPDLLRTALAHRQSGNVVWLERLQDEVDLLQKALDQQRAEEKTRLERMKLAALAELAAGAGHEINNPLAVISGQAQYILKHLTSLENECQEDPAATAWLEQWKSKVGRSLQTIIGQTQRVHHVLTDLMQFARPGAPKPQEVPVVALVHEVAAGLANLAQDKHLRLETPCAAREWVTQADPVQVRTALHGLVRNAMEAAPPEGWVGLRLETAEPGTIDVIVEDNGPGPAAATVDHLFDPFYSGRLAGRGRGLGLPTAWRLARQNGGDVRFDGIVEGRTRFVLRLPAQETGHVNYYLNGQSNSAEVNGQVQDAPDAANCGSGFQS